MLTESGVMLPKSRKIIIRAVSVARSICFVQPFLESLQDNYDVRLLSSPGDELTRICDEYSVAGYPIRMNRRFSPIRDFVSLVKLITLFYREKPDMVHSMTPKAGLLCMIAAWVTRVPKRVHTFTGLVWPTSRGIKRVILMLTDKITCFCSTHIIPEGQGVLNDLHQCITQKPMRVLGNGNIKGVDLSYFRRSPEIEVKSTDIRKDNIYTFIFVGRLVGDKGINELIKAFEKLNSKYVNSRLILVGRFEKEIDPVANDAILTIRSNSAIEFVGPKYKDELLAYYAASDCFVLPSYREGFPNTVLEAGAMGLPCIVTDINGSREIIENGYNGIVVPPKDVDSIYKAMEYIMNNHDIACKMAANARPLIEQRFDQRFVCQCLLDFYQEIL